MDGRSRAGGKSHRSPPANDGAADAVIPISIGPGVQWLRHGRRHRPDRPASNTHSIMTTTAPTESEDPPETAAETARHQLDRAASHIDVDPGIVERLKHPKSVHQVSIPVEMDSGETRIFTGYRAHHDSARGPFKGGLRYHPD